MTKPKYYVIVFGADIGDEKRPIQGKCTVFEFKADLAEWMTNEQVRPHSNEALAGQCLLQLPDGRAAMVIKGHAKALSTKVSVV